jgi:para-aminobenzoate synthetase
MSPADLFTGSDRCFWLDRGPASAADAAGSARPGRRSLIGRLGEDDLSLTYDATRREVVAHPSGEVLGEDIFEVLDGLLDGDPDTFWVGYFGYACRPDLPARPAVGVPDAIWMRCEHPDTGTRDGRVLKRSLERPPEHSTVPDSYAAAFDEVQRELRAGNSYEVNLTHRLEGLDRIADGHPDPLEVYQRLRESNPAPYAGYLRHQGTHLLSSSPECFATVDGARRIRTRPIKGTTPRGADAVDDARLRSHLATDPKFRAENLMITDLLRNDLSMVCKPGTVVVPELMGVESYASVHQLVTTVEGQLRDEVSTVQALRAIFPAGSMTGAPKLRTMEIIDRVEATPRGAYAGAFGWISGDGRADLGVVIRALVCGPDGVWQLGTGGGITVRSEVAEEWAETEWKVARLVAALGAAPAG